MKELSSSNLKFLTSILITVRNKSLFLQKKIVLKDTLSYQVQQLLRYNKIDFDKKELAFQIQSHLSYPSLHAITGVLSHFNIDNLPLTIPVDLRTLE